MANSFYDFRQALVDIRSGLVDIKWQDWLRIIFAQADATATAVAAIPGVNNKTIAQLNALGLGAGDANYLAGVTDGFNHLVRWDGAAWQWGPGDGGAGYFGDFAITPDTNQWALCNGAATTYLSGIGTATLAATAFTTPNLAGTPSYRKSAGAYTGVLNAASGTTGTGSTGTGTTGTGTTGAGTAHHHSVNITAVVINSFVGAPIIQAGGSGFEVNTPTTSGDESAHTHSVPGLSVPSLSVPALGVGSIDMPNLGTLPYVRR